MAFLLIILWLGIGVASCGWALAIEKHDYPGLGSDSAIVPSLFMMVLFGPMSIIIFWGAFCDFRMPFPFYGFQWGSWKGEPDYYKRQADEAYAKLLAEMAERAKRRKEEKNVS